MKQLLDKILGLILFSFFVVFPFSYEDTTSKWEILFVLIIVGLFILHFFLRRRQSNINNLAIVFAVLFMIIFDFAEKVNFTQQYSISINTSLRIPLSTVLLAIGMIAYLIKILIERKVQFIEHLFVRYFLYACAFLFVLMVLFYPFLWHHYQVKLDSNIQLLNKIFKYLMILLLTTNYISDEVRLRQINLGFILSLSTIVILNILF